MVELSRTIRFCVNADPPGADQPRVNTFAAWPGMRGLGRYYELHVTCRGQPEPRTGYFINIKHIDTAVRQHALPLLHRAIQRDPRQGQSIALGQLLRDMHQAINPALDGSMCSLALNLTPCLRLCLWSHDMSHIVLHHRYEFSAAHRLHVPEYSDQRNREIFGKCNNPAGHGHNYQLEVAVRVPIDDQGQIIPVDALDQLVDTHIIQHFDHKHLNVDLPQFHQRNPSVEHIAQVIFELLEPQVASLTEDAAATLEEVTVWETGKTRCTYRGTPAPA